MGQCVARVGGAGPWRNLRHSTQSPWPFALPSLIILVVAVSGLSVDIVRRPSKGMAEGATMQSDDWMVRRLEEDVKRTQLEERNRRNIGLVTFALILFGSWLGILNWWTAILILYPIYLILQLMAGLKINWW
jgi:hypothetical protein